MNKLMTIGLLVAFGQLAYAHTELAGSAPADRATLEAAPEQLMLHFSAPVRLTALGVQRAGGAKQDLGPLPTAASKDFAVPAPTALAEGAYTVTWRAMSEDTHVMTGEFAFTVGHAAMPAGHGTTTEDRPAAHDQHADHSSH